jgi:signal transduction histidine kinase
VKASDRPFLTRLLAWPRLRTGLVAASVPFVLFSFTWQAGHHVLAYRLYGTAAACLLVFTLLEQWPRRLPRRVGRWVLQVVAVAAIVPPLMAFWYWWGTAPGAPPFYKVPTRMEGFFALSFLGVIVAHWTALAALFRERDARIVQAERARGELEREAVSARLRQLQAQVEPHFLFNTLANVQALVDAGSPKASPVLASLIAYLRAAVPRLNQPSHRVSQELEMVQAYLHLMQLRMPDRLQFRVESDPATHALSCPPMTLLTLVENAVKHGIDPSLEGGRIDVLVLLRAGRCRLSVRDTGVGLQPGSQGLGTGLATLRERLRLMFGDEAAVRLSEVQPHGVLAELEWPA